MGNSTKNLRKRASSEAGLFVGFLFIGIVLMPIAIYFVGNSVFGDYAGEGYGDFFGTLSARIRQGDKVAWFLILSPYLVILIFRVMAWAWRRSARA